MVNKRLGFYMTVYRDEIWAHRLCGQIRELYPEAPILVTTDGLAHLPSLDRMGAKVMQFKDRLKVHGTGGMYSQRNMLAALVAAERNDVDIMFKIDPDSYLWRPFRHYPDADWFGGGFSSTTSLGTFNCCAGGCWGMRTSMINSIVSSMILLDNRLLAEDICYPRYSARVFDKPGDTRRDRELIIREDVVIGWAANQLGFDVTLWDEVYLRQNGELIQEAPYQFAVTHPVRSIP